MSERPERVPRGARNAALALELGAETLCEQMGEETPVAIKRMAMSTRSVAHVLADHFAPDLPRSSGQLEAERSQWVLSDAELNEAVDSRRMRGMTASALRSMSPPAQQVWELLLAASRRGDKDGWYEQRQLVLNLMARHPDEWPSRGGYIGHLYAQLHRVLQEIDRHHQLEIEMHAVSGVRGAELRRIANVSQVRLR